MFRSIAWSNVTPSLCRSPPSQSSGSRLVCPKVRRGPWFLTTGGKKLSTPRQRFACARLVIPYLTHSLRLFFNAAGSAGGISPPAAHRTVHKRLRLHGSSQPFPCDLAVAKRRGRSRLIPVTRLATISSELNHPLCSMPITGTSTLIRDDPPPAYASVLSPFVGPTYKVFP
jgi:hypothetical protein